MQLVFWGLNVIFLFHFFKNLYSFSIEFFLAVQAMQGNEAMTQQAVTWQMLRGPKHHLRTKGTVSRVAAWLLGSTLRLTQAAVSRRHISVQFLGFIVHTFQLLVPS